MTKKVIKMDIEDMIAWGALGVYIIIDITKHIITLGFKMIDKYIYQSKSEKE